MTRRIAGAPRTRSPSCRRNRGTVREVPASVGGLSSALPATLVKARESQGAPRGGFGAAPLVLQSRWVSCAPSAAAPRGPAQRAGSSAVVLAAVAREGASAGRALKLGFADAQHARDRRPGRWGGGGCRRACGGVPHANAGRGPSQSLYEASIIHRKRLSRLHKLSDHARGARPEAVRGQLAEDVGARFVYGSQFAAYAENGRRRALDGEEARRYQRERGLTPTHPDRSYPP